MATVLKKQNFDNTWDNKPTDEQCKKMAVKSMFSFSSIVGILMVGGFITAGVAHASLPIMLLGVAVMIGIMLMQYSENKRYYEYNTLTYDDLVKDYNHLGDFLKSKGKI